MAKKSKGNKVVVFKKKSEKSPAPVEVIIHDCITKQRVIAEYRGEAKWWFGTRMYKVYHPLFDGGFRWVLKLGRVLGEFDPEIECPSKRDIAAEKAMIKQLMAA